MKHFRETDAAGVTRCILDAIHHMHSVGVVHRDLKPENLLLQDAASIGEVKVRGE
jgi:serine/threonine protein kinase